MNLKACQVVYNLRMTNIITLEDENKQRFVTNQMFSMLLINGELE